MSYKSTDAVPQERKKRPASYQIIKNKGYTPHRPKENRNPRVKQRMKYEKAVKKLKSVTQLVTPLDGHYVGERNGIKDGISKSVKFN